MRNRLVGLFLAILSIHGIGFAQGTVPTSDPQAQALAAQSATALTGGNAVNDVTLTGTATWTAVASNDSGPVTLLAKGLSESRMDLTLSGGARTEIRNGMAGNWIGSGGVVHQMALHNCLTDPSWFFPALQPFANVPASPNLVLSYLGQTSSFQHVQTSTYNASFSAAQNLSTIDFYLDSQSLLPMVITFNEHPDDDQNLNIAVEIMFSDYRNVNGGMIPFHIQRYVNNSLVLDIQIASATVNAGIPDTNFNVE